MVPAADTEERVRDACERAAWDEAVVLVLEAYGAELLGYLRSISGGVAAEDAYADLAFTLWNELRGFEWRCSVRGYAFTLARRALLRQRRQSGREQRREQRYAEAQWLLDTISRTRTPTPAHRRSSAKDGVRRLREQLSEFERTLLMLRVDRDLSWRDLAMVMLEDEELDTEEARRRAEARLRKRFQAVTAKLRRLMQDAGLLE